MIHTRKNEYEIMKALLKILRYFLIGILLINFSSLVSQNHYVFFPIDSNDGLSGNQVRSIGQLPDGRMIIVTNGLVNLYDGTNFKYLHFEDEKSYSLSAYNGHHRMYVDNNNGLWIKNKYRLMYFDIEKEKFVPDLDSVLVDLNIKNELADIFIDSNSNLWYLTNDNILYLYNFTTKEKVQFAKDITKVNSDKDQLYDISVVDNQAFLFYRSGLMSCFDLKTRKLLYEQNPLSNSASSQYQQTLMVVPYKNFLYQIRNGISGGIMLKFNVNNKKWEKILNPAYRLNTLTIDDGGNCFVSTTRGFWYIGQNPSEKKYVPELSLEDGRIFDTEISTQYNDRSGGLWIGTLNRGILYYHPNRFSFRNTGFPLFKNLSSKNLMVNCFAEYENNLLVGTNNGLYQRSQTDKFLTKHKDLLPEVYCNMISKDGKRRIWVCSRSSGCYCLNNKKINHYEIKDDCLNIHESIDGSIYLLTTQGIYILDEEENQFRLISNSGEKFSSIKQVIDIGNGSLMCIANRNLIIINCKGEEVSLAPKNSALKNYIKQLSNHQYNAIYMDSRGLIWIGTQDGLNVLNESARILKSFHTEDGIVNNCIQSIIEDSENRIWVSTSSGISSIDIQSIPNNFSYSITNYNRYDGVIASEFMPRSACSASNGKLLWGGIDGFNEINIHQLNISYPLETKPILSNLYVFGNKIDKNKLYQGHTILNNSLSVTKEIDLLHHQNFIRVEFSAMNYINKFRTFYKYKLEGFEDNWHITTSTDGIGHATYTNLPPGSYRLKIQSSNSKENWGNDYRQLGINILPPLWQTPIFIAIYILVIITILYFGITYLIRKNRTKRHREQKEALDQMKFAFFTNVSHELRTPLTLIITPLNSIINKLNNDQLKGQLSNIKRNADDLLNIVNQLLDFRKLEMRGEHLQLSYCNISELLIQIGLSYEEIARIRQIDFTWKTDEEISAYVDAYKLQKIINNLLSNAFKFTPEGGIVTLNLHLGCFPESIHPSICIEVKDSGYGIPKKDMNHIFDRFYQVKGFERTQTGSGIGLHMVKEYIQLHEGKIDVESNVNQGSRFIIHIPTNLHPEQEPEQNFEDYTGKPLKLLIAEDNHDFRDFLKTELMEHYSVITANNGKNALEKIHEHNPDIVVSDYSMPEITGPELCKQIKSDLNTSHIPFIMLTARTSDKDQIESFEMGADAYLTKPFNMDILLLRIQKLIEKQQERMNLFKKAIVIKPQMVTTTDVDEDLIARAIDCIEKNMENSSYSIDQFSKDMFMDRTGLFRKLKAIVGQSPSAFLKSVRLKRAAQLLQSGLPVNEVAERVGFGTMSYFSKSFYEEFGVKPSKWIHQNK